MADLPKNAAHESAKLCMTSPGWMIANCRASPGVRRNRKTGFAIIQLIGGCLVGLNDKEKNLLLSFFSSEEAALLT